jgi:hypothetical protein
MDRIAINKKTALKIYWDIGFNSEFLLKLANASLSKLSQVSEGYYYADEVTKQAQFSYNIIKGV